MRKFFSISLGWIFIFAWLMNLGAAAAAKKSPSKAQPAVAASAAEIKPLTIGSVVPDVTLTNADGLTFPLHKLLKNQPSVLIFYRGGWCAYCNTQLGQLKQIETPLQKLGYQIIAVSPDSVEKIRESLKKHNLTYMLISDADASAVKAFGLAYQVDEATYSKMKKDYGIDLEQHSGKIHHILPVPAAFVLDQRGKILYSYANPDFKVRVDPQALLQAAEQAVQTKGNKESGQKAQ